MTKPRPRRKASWLAYWGNEVESVSHPSHYNAGRIEVIEFIEDQALSFSRGNAIKYVARAGKKDKTKEIEDLQKAVWYIQREIELLTAAKENRPVTRPNNMNPRKTDRPDALPASGPGRNRG